jgi:hypothetical protein
MPAAMLVNIYNIKYNYIVNSYLIIALLVPAISPRQARLGKIILLIFIFAHRQANGKTIYLFALIKE